MSAPAAPAPAPAPPTAPAPPPLDLNNVQGDVLAGLPKKTETCLFFQIDACRVKEFRTQLGKLIPMITTTAQVLSDMNKIAQNKKMAAERHMAPHLLKMSGVNIAFSQKGLTVLGIKDDIGDTAFDVGMLADAQNLGDEGTFDSAGKNFTPDWVPAFKNDIHGMFLVCGDRHGTVNETLHDIKKIFGVGSHHASIHEVLSLVGDVRPGKEKGHEHFGFLDGISQPAVQGVTTTPLPGQETVAQGIILLGREKDVPSKKGATRPPWALDGSFLSFRYLFQLVPEFDAFLKANPLPITGLSKEQGSELLGARLVGRWKSGAPVDLTPTADDPALGADPQRNNNFRYAFPDDPQTQTRCPFAAHTRKTNPRADLEDLGPPNFPAGGIPTESRRIIRQGIPFGEEVTSSEAASNKTLHGRGLLFVAYQSNIVNGFQFIQHSWANTQTFPIGKPAGVVPGFDPIIGQQTTGGSRQILGTNPSAQSTDLTLPQQWVVPKGGEYFFSPSIPALKETFALASVPHHPHDL